MVIEILRDGSHIASVELSETWNESTFKNAFGDSVTVRRAISLPTNSGQPELSTKSGQIVDFRETSKGGLSLVLVTTSTHYERWLIKQDPQHVKGLAVTFTNGILEDKVEFPKPSSNNPNRIVGHQDGE